MPVYTQVFSTLDLEFRLEISLPEAAQVEVIHSQTRKNPKTAT